jgi:hypothetical protein
LISAGRVELNVAAPPLSGPPDTKGQVIAQFSKV